MQASAYLTFPGTCEAAVRFYAQVFGSSDPVVMTHRGTPMEAHVPPEWLDKVLHSQMKIGATSLMASDAAPDRYQTPAGFAVSLQPTETDEAERVFAALSEGGVVTMPLAQTFWARRFGVLTDRFGTPWMINCE